MESLKRPSDGPSEGVEAKRPKTDVSKKAPIPYVKISEPFSPVIPPGLSKSQRKRLRKRLRKSHMESLRNQIEVSVLADAMENAGRSMEMNQAESNSNEDSVKLNAHSSEQFKMETTRSDVPMSKLPVENESASENTSLLSNDDKSESTSQSLTVMTNATENVSLLPKEDKNESTPQNLELVSKENKKESTSQNPSLLPTENENDNTSQNPCIVSKEINENRIQSEERVSVDDGNANDDAVGCIDDVKELSVGTGTKNEAPERQTTYGNGASALDGDSMRGSDKADISGDPFPGKTELLEGQSKAVAKEDDEEKTSAGKETEVGVDGDGRAEDGRTAEDVATLTVRQKKCVDAREEITKSENENEIRSVKLISRDVGDTGNGDVDGARDDNEKEGVVKATENESSESDTHFENGNGREAIDKEGVDGRPPVQSEPERKSSEAAAEDSEDRGDGDGRVGQGEGRRTAEDVAPLTGPKSKSGDTDVESRPKNAESWRINIDEEASDTDGDSDDDKSEGVEEEISPPESKRARVDGQKEDGPGTAKGQEGGEDTRQVFVTNLPYFITVDRLEETFRACGELNRVSLPICKQTGVHKGFAFVQFRDEASVEKAMKDIDNTVVDGKIIRVRKYEVRDNGRRSDAYRQRGGLRFFGYKDRFRDARSFGSYRRWWRRY